MRCTLISLSDDGIGIWINPTSTSISGDFDPAENSVK